MNKFKTNIISSFRSQYNILEYAFTEYLNDAFVNANFYIIIYF